MCSFISGKKTFIDWGLQMCSFFSFLFFSYVVGGLQSVPSVTNISLMQWGTSPLHIVDQVFDFGLWNVGPLHFSAHVKLLDIGRNWNTLSYTLIQSISNMLIGDMSWVCRPCKNLDVLKLLIDHCSLGLCNMWMNGTIIGLRISSQYLCAFKLQSVKDTCVCCQYLMPGHTITPPHHRALCS